MYTPEVESGGCSQERRYSGRDVPVVGEGNYGRGDPKTLRRGDRKEDGRSDEKKSEKTPVVSCL